MLLNKLGIVFVLIIEIGIIFGAFDWIQDGRDIFKNKTTHLRVRMFYIWLVSIIPMVCASILNQTFGQTIALIIIGMLGFVILHSQTKPFAKLRLPKKYSMQKAGRAIFFCGICYAIGAIYILIDFLMNFSAFVEIPK
jgi:hypothetical protein